MAASSQARRRRWAVRPELGRDGLPVVAGRQDESEHPNDGQVADPSPSPLGPTDGSRGRWWAMASKNSWGVWAFGHGGSSWVRGGLPS